MGVWWHALAFVTHERAKMSHKPGRNVTQAGPKCHTRAKMSHSHVIMLLWCESAYDVKQTVEWPMIWDYMTLTWRHRNEIQHPFNWTLTEVRAWRRIYIPTEHFGCDYLDMPKPALGSVTKWVLFRSLFETWFLHTVDANRKHSKKGHTNTEMCSILSSASSKESSPYVRPSFRADFRTFVRRADSLQNQVYFSYNVHSFPLLKQSRYKLHSSRECCCTQFFFDFIHRAGVICLFTVALRWQLLKYRMCTCETIFDRSMDCYYAIHVHMMTSSNGNIIRVTGHLCREFTGPRWIPHTKASDAELWCFLWSASWIYGWVNIVRLVIWVANTLIMTSL